ncbi:hypothetical protein CP556_24485 [Natrinema sp. CBA1119]|uniref:HalOD1 output domain-containing protein n=1 Tax=Natrinema sp. CBA1119 TaxID=1608465 RepID=UPI000BF337FF|nr:HalOD1 output domain-containing protein [Natrinema sp. CBA1119]PGF14182.1 hypothetical protein CP556_24485 [Natrinema sp. CBA1119]
MAEEEGTEALDPLYEAIDPDALDSFFLSETAGTQLTTVTFTYCEYEVTVNNSRTITVVEN